MTEARLPLTPSQTVGPFFALGLDWEDGRFVVPEGVPGAIWIRGRVLDGSDDPVPDAMVETWQADPGGGFDHPDDPRGGAGRFRGFGRSGTDTEGRYRILTMKPGPLPTAEGGTEAPHIDVSVFSRGLLQRLVTRIYFPDEVEANAADPVLRSIADPHRRASLVAVADGAGFGFDIHLQGDDETVFFDL